jgi:transposase
LAETRVISSANDKPDTTMNHEKTFHLGVDVAKATLRAALLGPDGTWREADFTNNRHGFERMFAWLAGDLPATVACLESTGRYGLDLTAHLHANGVPVAVVNPRLVRDYGRSLNCRTKTDPVDARIIAGYSRERHPQLWTPPAETPARLRALHARRDNLMRMSVSERLRREGSHESVLGSIDAHIDWLAGQILAIDKDVASLIASDAPLSTSVRLLRSIPGIGALTASRLICLVDTARFGSARAISAHSGVTPSERTSGTSVHGRAHMSKVGDAGLRRALYMPSISARNGAGFRTWTSKLRAAGKPEKVILGAVMHRLIRVAYGVLKSGEPYCAERAFRPA